MLQKNKAGQMFLCVLKSVTITKEGSRMVLVEGPKGLGKTLEDLIGKDVMVCMENPQGELFPEDQISSGKVELKDRVVSASKK